MSYQITLTPTARRQLAALPKHVLPRIDQAILRLSENPRPHGVEKLKGGQDLYRIRVGSYRIIYSISDAALIVLIVRVGDRKEIYRDL